MKVHEIITNRILEKLENGVVPWHKPWSGGELPKNLITKKEYRGINTFMLSCSGFSSPFWASYKQIIELGGQVNKGEKGWPVVFWKFLKKEDFETGEIKTNIPFMRYYTVFNVEQTIGIDESKIPDLTIKYNKLEAIKICDDIIKDMPKRPEINHVEPRAYYSPTKDYINMPKKETFEGSEEYYSTLFHELTHATGHEKRLNRKILNVHGSEIYSKEELVAEMGAAFLCGYCQIENKVIDNSASYIKSWLGRLKNDKQMVIQAAGQAQKATDFILNKKFE